MPDESHDCGAPLGIGAAAEHLGVSVEALRYYESVGLVSPERDGGDRRRYAQRDLDALHVVLTLRGAGFTMAQITDVMAAKIDAPPAVLIARARERLLRLRAEVRDRQRALRSSQRLLDQWLAELDAAEAERVASPPAECPAP